MYMLMQCMHAMLINRLSAKEDEDSYVWGSMVSRPGVMFFKLDFFFFTYAIVVVKIPKGWAQRSNGLGLGI